MSITFELTLSDLRAFQSHLRRVSPEYRRARWITVGLAAVLAITGMFSAETSYGWVNKIVACLLLFVVLWAVMSFVSWLVNSFVSNVRSNQKGMSGILCKHTLTLDAEGLTAVTPVNEGRHFWRGMYRVDATEDYIFIHNQPNTAYIIPRRAFASVEEADLFYRTAWDYHQAAGGKVG